jgi:hypothetical protein
MSEISKPAYRKFVQRLETNRRMAEYNKPVEDEGALRGLLAKRTGKEEKSVEGMEDDLGINSVLEEYFELVTKLAGEPANEE